jgi:hypothetical protein
MHAPNMSAQMAAMNQPTAAENTQHKLGTAAEQDFMRNTIGTDKNPGAARQYGNWVNYETDPQMIRFQEGQANGGTQMNFNGANLLRSAAVNHASGSGTGESALRTGYSGLGSALTGATAGVRSKAFGDQAGERLGMAKMGQGMSDANIAGLNNLGQDQTQQNATKLYTAEANAERNLQTQIGLAQTGASIGGGLASAAGGAWDGDGNFSMSKFGLNAARGFSGGSFYGNNSGNSSGKDA